MNDDDMFINRIIQGGIYFLTLQDDKKMRPYVVISNNSGYGMNILSFSITSKCPTSNAVLPIVMSNKVSFIRISGTKEISPKTVIESDFGGIMRPDIFKLAITLFAQRFMNISDADGLKREVSDYLDEIEKQKFPLHSDGNIIFTKEKFLSDSFGNEKATIDNVDKDNIIISKAKAGLDERKFERYPLELKFWKTQDLKSFKTDMYTLPIESLMKKYSSSEGRIHFIKRNIKLELQKRKGVYNG